jgi:N-acetylmuramoyl-L-alanine amidase
VDLMTAKKIQQYVKKHQKKVLMTREKLFDVELTDKEKADKQLQRIFLGFGLYKVAVQNLLCLKQEA